MDDRPKTPSGSRWEPTQDDQATVDQAKVDRPEQPAASTDGEPVTYAPSRPVARRRPRGGVLLAGGALGVALVAGAGVYALGQVTGDDDQTGQVTQLVGDRGPSDGDHDGDRDGDGRVGPGYAPPGQTQPGGELDSEDDGSTGSVT